MLSHFENLTFNWRTVHHWFIKSKVSNKSWSSISKPLCSFPLLSPTLIPPHTKKVGNDGNLEITEDSIAQLLDERIRKEEDKIAGVKNWEDMSLEEIDELEDEEDERVLEVSKDGTWLGWLRLSGWEGRNEKDWEKRRKKERKKKREKEKNGKKERKKDRKDER